MLYLRNALLPNDCLGDRIPPGLLPLSRMPDVLGMLGLPTPLTSGDTRGDTRPRGTGTPPPRSRLDAVPRAGSNGEQGDVVLGRAHDLAEQDVAEVLDR